MAGDAVIGALRAVLGLDTADFDKGLKSAQSGVASFGAAVGTGMAAAAAAVAAAGAAIGIALNRTIDDMDKLNKTSQKLGIPVEQLSALAYAADLADVSFEQLSKGVGKLNKAMVEAAAKPTSDAANAFRALGVSVTDSNGKLKSSEVVMGDLANAFEGLKDGPGKTAVAMAIFGKAGADLIPLLNGGRDSLKEMNDEAKQFGAIVSTQGAKQAEAFNDNMTRLGYAVKGVFVQIAERLLPILVDVSNKMVEAAKNSSGLELVITALTASMKGLVTAGVLVSATMQVAGQALSIIWGGLAKLIKGDVSGAWEHLKTKTGEIATVAGQTQASLAAIWRGGEMDQAVAAYHAQTEKATKAQKDFNYAAMGGKSAFDKFIESQEKSRIAQEAELATTGMAAGAKERLRVIMQGLEAAQKKSIDELLPAQRQKLLDTAAAADLMALKLGNLSLLGGEANPFIPLGVAIDATNLKLQEGALKAEDYAYLSGQAAQLTSKLWQDSAASLGNSFESIGSSMGQMNESWARFAKVGQAIGAAIAFVNAYVAASEAFAKTPFPGNIAVAAGVLAKGIGMVAAIKSASAPKMAMGGAFRVPGGIGGGDKVPFNAMLEPGELVEISSNRPGGYRNDAGRSQGSRGTINVSIPAVLQPLAVALFPFLNEAIRDGHELKLAPA